MKNGLKQMASMERLENYCAPGTTVLDKWVTIAPNIALRVIRFTPQKKSPHPPVVFIAGWVSLIVGWQDVLQEMTRDFNVYYVETREKISANVPPNSKFSVEAIGRDIACFVEKMNLADKDYILFGSSLGATAILDCCRFLKQRPRCLVLIGPNAVFRVPGWGILLVRMTPYYMYFALRPVVKWYLRNFRLDLKNDYAQYQKYCNALDAADPWRLKKALLAVEKYEVWPILRDIPYPTLLIGASKDVLHEPENLQRMAQLLPDATYLDLETNFETHTKLVVERMRVYLTDI